MSKIINQKEIQKLFNEFLLECGIKISKRKNFENFLKYLETDFYDWVRENLRGYFREEDQKK